MHMRKYYQYLGLALIMVFSFYYTEKIALIVLNKNPLMQEINQVKGDYEEDFVNATIEGDYIIPGINGLAVNTRESFYGMQELEAFNHYYLVFDQVKPDVSLEDNKDKIIHRGNAKLKKVSILFRNESVISDYFKELSYKASLLVDLETYQKNSYFEQINNEVDGFDSLENNLNLNKENKNICVVHDKNFDICLKKKKYLVEPTLTLNGTNYIDVKNHLDSGSIILIDESATLSDVKLLLKEIKYKNYQLVYLSEIVSEENLSA